ncbi:MAG: site-specific integrase [Firmicutes bacterium]|nr:site-specific integrase [Bacillota bacterium]
MAEQGASPHTVSGYRCNVLAFFSWFRGAAGEDALPERVTSIDLQEYQSWLRGVRKLKPNAVNRKLKAVRAWLRWCASEGRAPRLPDFPHVPQARKAPEALEGLRSTVFCGS